MFSTKHYVPILKWKRAEQGALSALTEDQKNRITPLIQLVMPKYKPSDQLEDVVASFEKQALRIPEKLIEVWGRTPIFIDVSLLFTSPLKAKSIKIIGRGGQKQGGIFIPVLHLNDDQEIKNAAYSLAKETKGGLCLRLVCSDFSDPNKLNQIITNILSVSNVEEKNIDLLVDIKETEENGNKCTKYLRLSQGIPHLQKWRTFIFASGSFPENLSQYKIDEENLIPRIDWQSWKQYVNGKTLKRTPAFGDYAIQHPVYKESSQFYHPTTSIKYTLEKEWLIMKGKQRAFELYLASAAELVKDNRFYGKKFSNGDDYIVEKANHFTTYIKDRSVKGTGSTETWLKAGINHHLAVVAHQIANLS